MLSGWTGLLSVDHEADEAPLTDEEEWPISQEELRKKISKQVGEIIQVVIGLNSDGGFFLMSLFTFMFLFILVWQ